MYYNTFKKKDRKNGRSETVSKKLNPVRQNGRHFWDDTGTKTRVLVSSLPQANAFGSEKKNTIKCDDVF